MEVKPPISFRLTNSEWEVLAKEKQPDESINQTAARLLREKLGIVDDDNKYLLENSTLEFWIADTVRYQVAGIREQLEKEMKADIIKLLKEVEEIKKRLPKPRTKKAS